MCKGHKLIYRKFHLNIIKNLFCCEDGQTLEHVAQRGCEVSTLGDIEDPTGQSLEQQL